MAVPLRRRSLLTAGLLAVLTACGSNGSPAGRGADGRPAPTPADPDQTARQRIGSAMTSLIAAYDSTSAHAVLRRQLAEELAALHGGRPTASPSASSSPTTSSSVLSPATTRTVVSDATLAAREQELGALCATELLATSPALARLTASVAAGAAQRAALLGAKPVAAGSSGGDRIRPSAAEVSALQAALGAEHATVYGYGVLGALLSDARRTQATSDYQLHRARRDALEAELTTSGIRPAAAAAAYELPFAVTDAGSARRLAALLEERLAAVYANAVQAGENELRDQAATQLRLAALRALSWRGTSTPFPGLPER
ncbi:ferritin-like domain-containing protein [Streptacidiphilus rugosus]|uniref:ferritin-like domain-containing protein n=1 Tax=Streptacidiphilus rugosus TaxID=405783 RepID=UPI000B13E6D7